MFNLPKIKIDLNHVFQDLLVIGLAAAAAGVFFKTSQYFGFMSYNGLSPAQVHKTYRLFLKNYELLSMVEGDNPLMGGHFYRGIAIGKGGSGFPIYYHYSNDGQGNVEFNIYPEFYETWTTNEGIFGIGKWFTGHSLFP